MALRQATLAVLVLAAATTAGCNLRDWYNQNGTVQVDLLAIGPEESDLEQFRNLSVALVSLSMRQSGSVDPQEFTLDRTVVDLVKLSQEGGRMRLAEHKFNLRAVSQVTLRIEPIGGTDAAGHFIPGCFRGVPQDPPCIRVDTGGVYRLEDEPAFSPKRGGTVTFAFPLSVHWSPNVGEWYVATRTGVVTEE